MRPESCTLLLPDGNPKTTMTRPWCSWLSESPAVAARAGYTEISCIPDGFGSHGDFRACTNTYSNSEDLAVSIDQENGTAQASKTRIGPFHSWMCLLTALL